MRQKKKQEKFDNIVDSKNATKNCIHSCTHFFPFFCCFRLFVSHWISEFARAVITRQYFKNNNFNVAPIRASCILRNSYCVKVLKYDQFHVSFLWLLTGFCTCYWPHWWHISGLRNREINSTIYTYPMYILLCDLKICCVCRKFGKNLNTDDEYMHEFQICDILFF